MSAGVKKLSREDIEKKAEEVLFSFNSKQLEEPRLTPIAELGKFFVDEYNVVLLTNQNLGHSVRGNKIYGACVFRPATILLDQSLDPNGPRFRFTLAHELGHLVLHRKLNLDWDKLDIKEGRVSDAGKNFYIPKRGPQTPRQWLEWQANTFASALILPRATLSEAIAQIQIDLGYTRRRGTIYVDRQWDNLKAYKEIIPRLQFLYQVSRPALVTRLRRLGLLTDARDFNVHHISALFSEDDS